jgi:FAD/FMN-containing dehydrogenase
MAPSLSLLLVGASAFFSSFAQADTCGDVARLYPSVKVAREAGAFAKDYATSQTVYWNKGAGEQKATCLIYPTTTEDVSNILKILNSNSERFAVKGGGHMPNKEFNG